MNRRQALISCTQRIDEALRALLREEARIRDVVAACPSLRNHPDAEALLEDIGDADAILRKRLELLEVAARVPVRSRPSRILDAARRAVEALRN